MSNAFIIAVAPPHKVQQAIDELLADQQNAVNYTLVSTKAYRHSAINDYIDLDNTSLDEDVSLPIPKDASLVVLQNSDTLISFINVYRCLKTNGLENFRIKVAGKPSFQTTLNDIFGFVCEDSYSSDNDVIWISPAKLEKRKEFERFSDLDWESEAIDFNQTVTFYQGAKERFEQGYDWQDTVYFKDTLASIELGERRFGCTTKDDLVKRCEGLDALYLDIKNNGWKQAQDSDYVTINIGEQGQIYFNDGRHRVVIAKLLNLESIPVKVAARHPAWIAFKQEIKLYADTHDNGKVYNKLSHPDLENIPHTQDDWRGDVILSNLEKHSGTMLDIGCHWGYFCGRFEDEGFSATGVEADVSNYYFLNKLKLANGHSFHSINKSIFDVVTGPMFYDVVLALNIFHHFLKTEEGYYQLVELLGRLQSQVLFLQTHSPDEPQMHGAYKNFSSDEFSDFVKEMGGFSTSTKLQSYDNGRALYKLSR